MLVYTLLVSLARAQETADNAAADAATGGYLDPTFLADKAYTFGMGAIKFFVILLVGRMVAGWAANLVKRFGGARNLDVALVGFLSQIAYYTVFAAAMISALGAAGVQTTSLLAIFTSAGLAVGLAMQGSLSNFASGVMILFFKPFTVGDLITAGGETGGVVDIGLFATTMVNPSNHKIIVANSAITGGNITNYTALGKRRTTVEFGVAYGADIQRVCEVAMSAAATCPVVITDPVPPEVAFTEMAASSLNFVCHSWSESGDWLDCMHQVRTAIYDALNREGIEIPFDQIVVHQAPSA